MKPYYEDEWVTLYHGDCIELADVWTGADVLVTDPPYGSGGMAKLYGRVPSDAGRGRVIASDETAEARDAVLALWAERPVLCFGTPRMAEPPGGWDHRLVWDKREPGLNGGPWRYNHESIFVRGEGWVRVNARSFSVISVPSGNWTPEKADHVHAKPVALMRSLIAAAPPRHHRRPVRRFRLHPRRGQGPRSSRHRRRTGGALLRDSRPKAGSGRPRLLGGRRMTHPCPFRLGVPLALHAIAKVRGHDRLAAKLLDSRLHESEVIA